MCVDEASFLAITSVYSDRYSAKFGGLTSGLLVDVADAETYLRQLLVGLLSSHCKPQQDELACIKSE